MKNLALISLLYFAFVAGPLSFASAAEDSATESGSAPRMEDQLRRYAEIDPEQKCPVNRGAGIDTKIGGKFNSACLASYRGAKEAAQKYLNEKAAGEAEIKELTSMSVNMCGANRSTSGQVACFKQAGINYEKAAQLQKKLAEGLAKAHKEAEEWREKSAKALHEYRNDLQKIEKVEADAKERAEALRRDGDSRAAAFTLTKVQRAPVASVSGVSVAARDGAANSLIEYKEKFKDLTGEQQASQEHAARFASTAQTEANVLLQRSRDYQEMANRAKAQAAASATGGTDPSGSTVSAHRIPSPAEGRAARAEFEARQRAAANGGTGTSQGAPGITSSDQPAPTGNETTTSSSNPSSATNAASAAAGMLGGAAGGGGGSAGSGSGSNSPDPFAGMNGASAQGGNSPPSAQSSPKSTNFGEVLGTRDPRKKEEPAESSPDQEAKTNSSSDLAAAEGGLSGNGGEKNSGASTAPGIRGADGKPLRTGFSSAAGGGVQSSRQNMDRDAAPREPFAPDLKSGAVSIAGSEMKSAIQSLAEEFGAADLDLDLGELTAEEKNALAPLDGSAHGEERSAGPAKSGRRTASVIQGSDASIQDEQSMALFSRISTAHARALKRGNLILGTRKKL